MWTVFYAVSSKTDEALSIKPSINAFVFGYFNGHQMDWVTYSVGNSNGLTQVVNFTTWSCNCDSDSPALSDLLISSDPEIFSRVTFNLLGN